jgi:preprotein translocase subunit YajC
MHTEEGTEPVQNSGQLLILAVFVVFAVWVLSRGRRQQREAQMTQSRVRPGAEVMMTSGLYGTVVEVEDDGTIRVETSPGTVSRWDRRAVARIISSPDEVDDVDETDETDETDEATATAETADRTDRADTAETAATAGAESPVEPVYPVEPARPNRDAAPPDRD